MFGRACDVSKAYCVRCRCSRVVAVFLHSDTSERKKKTGLAWTLGGVHKVGSAFQKLHGHRLGVTDTRKVERKIGDSGAST